jgi:hypothetical protein
VEIEHESTKSPKHSFSKVLTLGEHLEEFCLVMSRLRKEKAHKMPFFLKQKEMLWIIHHPHRLGEKRYYWFLMLSF